MLKLIILLSVVVLVALFWTVLRRRLQRGVRAGMILYAILMIVRLSQAKTDQETLIELAVMVGASGVLWVVVWAFTSWLLARKTP